MLSLLKEEEKIDVEGTVPRDEEAETEVLQLQTEQWQGLPASHQLVRGKKGFSLICFRGTVALSATWFWTSILQIVKQ